MAPETPEEETRVFPFRGGLMSPGCAVKCPRQQWVLFLFIPLRLDQNQSALLSTSTNQQKMEQKNSIEMFICYSTPPFVDVLQVDPFFPPVLCS